MAKPFTRLKWTLERAAAEFNINPRTLSARMKQAGIDYEPNRGWTTLEVVRAIYNDLESERIRKTRAEADQIEKENAQLDGRLVDVEEFSREILPALIDIKRVIMASKMTDGEKDDVLGKMAKAFRDCGNETRP